MRLSKLSPFQYRILAGTITSASLLVLFIYLGWSLKNQISNEIYRQTKNTAQLVLSHFEDEIAEIDARLQHIGRLLETVDFNGEDSPDREKHLHELLKYFGSDSISGPGISNKHGLLVASGQFYPIPRLALGERANVRVHADNPGISKLNIGPSVIGLIDKQWSIQLTRPLRNKSGEFAGVVMIAYQLSNISDLYQKLQLTDYGIMALTGIDGFTRIRIAQGAVTYHDPPRPLELALPRIKNGEMEGKFYKRGSTDGVARIGSFVVSAKVPFYVLTAYDDQYLKNQYIGSWIVSGVAWVAITGIMFGAMIMIARFDLLRQQTDLKIAYAAGAAVASERQKILADVHDSIGASLTGLLSQMNQGVPDVNILKRKVIETLTELRLLADTTQATDGDLNLALASVRHRMSSAIERSGIVLHWQVDEIPKVAKFTSRDELALKLILLEAISNVLHHASAKSITVKACYDRHAGAIIISVIDDGCGFDSSAVINHSHGIGNMRSRARSISIQTTLAIHSISGRGTTVRIDMAAPSQVEVNS